MSSHHPHAALRQYQSIGATGAATDANAHKLIEMLLAGALDRMAVARGSIMRGAVAEKLQAISSAVSIIEHLKLQLDMQAGGEIAKGLGRLYDYMVRRLLKANADNDPLLLDEVSGLLRDIKSAWDDIPQNVRMRH